MWMEEAVPSDAGRAELDAWTKRIGDPDPGDDKPMALVGREAKAFALGCRAG